VGFVVDKVALGQVFSEYFGFPCQSSFQQILHPHNHPGQVEMFDVPRGPSFDSTPTSRILKKYNLCLSFAFVNDAEENEIDMARKEIGI
jgi:hypothetical protein